MNIKNVLDYIRYKQLNWYGHGQRVTKKGSLEEFQNGAHLEDEEMEEEKEEKKKKKKKEDLEVRGCRK